MSESCTILEDFTCCEANCPLTEFNPALCFEAGEQIPEPETEPEPEPEKKEPDPMPQYETGQCSNCERGPLSIHKKLGLCGSCRKACEYATTADEREAALKAAKEKFSGKPVFREGTRRKGIVTPVNKRPGTPATPPAEPLIETILKAHEMKVEELREIRALLLGLKKYGAQVELPEVRL